MADTRSPHETLVLETLKTQPMLTMDQMKAMLPPLNWWELLHTVDVLSRRDDLILRRKGFDYQLQGQRPHTYEPSMRLPDALIGG